MREAFRKFAHRTSEMAGSAGAFGTAVAFIVVWALSGHHFRYSETWQLVVNTATTIVTFLMVFLIQNAQNRDSRAIHLKLNELIRATHDARDQCIDLETWTEEELDALQAEYKQMHEQMSRHIARARDARRLKKGGLVPSL